MKIHIARLEFPQVHRCMARPTEKSLSSALMYMITPNCSTHITHTFFE